MYKICLFENNQFVTCISDEIRSLIQAMDLLQRIKLALPNVEETSNTTIKYNKGNSICYITIIDRWNNVIKEAKFQDNLNNENHGIIEQIESEGENNSPSGET